MKAVIDVFNGDADGICALHQLRLAAPRPGARLVSGVKRDIALLRHLAGTTGAEITVLDVSLERNREYLLPLLASCRVFYVDHHYADEIPVAANLEAHIDPDPELCTSLIVDNLLAGRFRAWAVVGAFGDNLHRSARRAAAALNLAPGELERLRELGELLNYNGYGASLADLHLDPTELYRAVGAYPDPLEFQRDSSLLAALRQGMAADLTRTRALAPWRESPAGRIFQLPPAPWARRVAGVYANELARSAPAQAHALLVENPDGTMLVSVRAPQERPRGADALCRAFPTGGGRAGAAGINALPAEMRDKFCQAFGAAFSS
ncbi:acetyltransferase [Desulfurivibrio sp. C05AmB]|uniref:acetyltransferase n=1 Tax=Desulfurivibrio sp. C05AmB TaxID=3374371 RepID=UPI00376EE20A